MAQYGASMSFGEFSVADETRKMMTSSEFFAMLREDCNGKVDSVMSKHQELQAEEAMGTMMKRRSVAGSPALNLSRGTNGSRPSSTNRSRQRPRSRGSASRRSATSQGLTATDKKEGISGVTQANKYEPRRLVSPLIRVPEREKREAETLIHQLDHTEIRSGFDSMQEHDNKARNRRKKYELTVDSVFYPTRDLLESYWSQFRIGKEARRRFTEDVCKDSNKKNYNSMAREVSLYANRSEYFSGIMQLMNLRESYLKALISWSRSPSLLDSSNKSMQESATVEVYNMILLLRHATLQIVDAVCEFRAAEGGNTPILWEGRNYVLKMQDDLGILTESSLPIMLPGYRFVGNPMMLPPRYFGVGGSIKPQSTSRTESPSANTTVGNPNNSSVASTGSHALRSNASGLPPPRKREVHVMDTVMKLGNSKKVSQRTPKGGNLAPIGMSMVSVIQENQNTQRKLRETQLQREIAELSVSNDNSPDSSPPASRPASSSVKGGGRGGVRGNSPKGLGKPRLSGDESGSPAKGGSMMPNASTNTVFVDEGVEVRCDRGLTDRQLYFQNLQRRYERENRRVEMDRSNVYSFPNKVYAPQPRPCWQISSEILMRSLDPELNAKHQRYVDEKEFSALDVQQRSMPPLFASEQKEYVVDVVTNTYRMSAPVPNYGYNDLHRREILIFGESAVTRKAAAKAKFSRGVHKLRMAYRGFTAKLTTMRERRKSSIWDLNAVERVTDGFREWVTEYAPNWADEIEEELGEGSYEEMLLYNNIDDLDDE